MSGAETARCRVVQRRIGGVESAAPKRTRPDLFLYIRAYWRRSKVIWKGYLAIGASIHEDINDTLKWVIPFWIEFQCYY